MKYNKYILIFLVISLAFTLYFLHGYRKISSSNKISYQSMYQSGMINLDHCIKGLLSLLEISEEDKEKTDSKLFETALKNEIYAFRRIESGLVILVNSFPLETPFREDIRFSRLSYISRLLEDALKNDENILKVRKAISNTEAELGKLVMLDTEIFMQEDNQLLLKNIWDQLEKDLDDIINNN